MITRVWRGWAPAERVQEYERHYRSEVLSVLRGVAGFDHVGHYETAFETS
ncbi:MAG TPA: hypothetical protein VFM27_05005 [Acidimicrobiales bacterium]|nr:hypothetical protein [Acidimicrobiales bacterium]